MTDLNGSGYDPTLHGDRMAGRYQGQQGAQMIGPEPEQSWVVFYKGSVHNPFKSKEQGIPVYDAVDFMKVHHPGEPSNVWNQPVREFDKYMYPKQWEAYQSGRTEDTAGTPLNMLLPQQPELVDHLKAMHIRTIQQLANLTDSAMQNIQFGRELSNKAKAYLDISEKGKEFHAANSRIDELQAQVADLMRALSDRGLSAAPPPPADPSGASQALAAANAEIMALKAKLSRTGTRKKVKATPESDAAA